MANNDNKIAVIIAFDPNDPKREGKTERLDPAEAHSLVQTGRAQYADTKVQTAHDAPASTLSATQ